MNISIFNRKYLIRRFSPQHIVKGYVTAPHEDFEVSLHVHPPGKDTIYALPEGERKVKRLEAHGTVALQSSNQELGIKGDLLYYYGNWYECVSAVLYDHTILSHWNYEFVLLPDDGAGTIDADEIYGRGD